MSTKTSAESLQEAWTFIKENPTHPQLVLTLGVGAFVIALIWILACYTDNKIAQRVVDMDAPIPCGDITLEALQRHDGSDLFLPIYFAVRGKVYDVSKGRDFYGPGGGYNVFAGREVARALATMSLDPKDCTGDLEGLSEAQLKTLGDWESKFEQKYGVVGQVVAPKELTLEQLAEYDGREPGKPILLAIKGVIYDVTKGRDYYGPDGMYPFGGRECARALAKYSTDIADCVEDTEGLGAMELDMLRDWQGRFRSKYPVVGRVVVPAA